jgi:hypothetical protein
VSLEPLVYTNRAALVAMVEVGTASHSPLYTWTKEARKAAWASLSASEAAHRSVAGKFTELMKVCAAALSGTGPTASAHALHPQAYYAIHKGSLETAQAKLSRACTAFGGDKGDGEDWFDVVARTVQEKIAAQRQTHVGI